MFSFGAVPSIACAPHCLCGARRNARSIVYVLHGYYVLVTSELGMSPEEVLAHPRGQQEIEASFCIMKSDLDLRPMHVTKASRIKAHVTICFAALLISWLLCSVTKCSAAKLQETLRKCVDYPLKGNACSGDAFYNGGCGLPGSAVPPTSGTWNALTCSRTIRRHHP